MDSEMNADRVDGPLIPADVAGLDRGRTSYMSADVLRELHLEDAASLAAGPGSPKGSPKPEAPKPGSPKPDSPRPGSPKPEGPKPGSPKGSPKP